VDDVSTQAPSGLRTSCSPQCTQSSTQNTTSHPAVQTCSPCTRAVPRDRKGKARAAFSLLVLTSGGCMETPARVQHADPPAQLPPSHVSPGVPVLQLSNSEVGTAPSLPFPRFGVSPFPGLCYSKHQPLSQAPDGASTGQIWQQFPIWAIPPSLGTEKIKVHNVLCRAVSFPCSLNSRGTFTPVNARNWI